MARDAAGRSPYDWLVEAVPPGSSTVVDLACGSRPVARLLPGCGSSGSTGRRASWRGPGGVVRASWCGPWPTAMPVADGAADAVVLSMALMLLPPSTRCWARSGGCCAREGPSWPPSPCGRRPGAGVRRDPRRPRPAPPATRATSTSTGGRPAVRGRPHPGGRRTGLSADDRDRDDAGVVVRSFYAPGTDDDRVARRWWGWSGGCGRRPWVVTHPAAGRRRRPLTGPVRWRLGWIGRGLGHGPRSSSPASAPSPPWATRPPPGPGCWPATRGWRRRPRSCAGPGARSWAGPGGSGPRTTSTARPPAAWAASASSRWRPRSWPWPTPASPATPATGWAWSCTPAPAG